MNGIKEHWRELKEGRPGHRFQDRYHRKRDSQQSRFNPMRILKIITGVVITIVGLLLVPAPGPGWPVVFIGLALLSVEFLVIARFLDWVEVRGRRIIEKIRERRKPRLS
jgi:uncharacterized protein (TIGR02611 family)